MARLLETKDKTGRYIYLSTERWHHISTEHPEVAPYLQEFDKLLKIPTRVVSHGMLRYFYRYFKHTKAYLLVIVKYLNGDGFIITAYFVRRIR